MDGGLGIHRASKKGRVGRPRDSKKGFDREPRIDREPRCPYRFQEGIDREPSNLGGIPGHS